MKKYRKALFCAAFFLVFVGLLIYRTEYLKLWYTFEAGGLLTVPELPSNCLVVNDSAIEKKLSSPFSFPRSVWTVANNLHVFSAFITSSDEIMTAVALGMGRSSEDCSKYLCHIWFSVKDLKYSTNGKFSCSQFGDSLSNDSLLEFHCEVNKSSIRGKPFIFLFIDESNSKYFVPIHQNKKKPAYQSAALCILPDFLGLEPLSLVEFLSYHELIGFTDIIVYDNGVQYEILNSIDRVLRTIDYLKSFSVIQWNFPINDYQAAKEIIHRDCSYRIEGYSKAVAILDWNKYIIPVNKLSIADSFGNLIGGKTSVINMSVKKCCDNSKDNIVSNKTWPMIFRKTSCSVSLDKVPFPTKTPGLLGSLEFVEMSPSEIYINEYSVCDLDNPTNQDNKPIKYFSELLESILLRIWKSGTLLES